MATIEVEVVDRGTTAALASGSVSITIRVEAATGGDDSGGGAVDSVNGHTGVVVLGADDVGAATAAQGALADSAVQPDDLPSFGSAAASDAGDFEPAGTSAAAIAGEVTRADGAYDHAGAAAAAQSASQPVDSDLTAISLLTTTGYGRAFLTLANQGALMALLGSSSDTAQGIVELATGTEAVTGTDTARAVTPAALKAALDDLQGRLVDGAPGILDTFAEVATQLASDESAVAALTTAVSGKLGKSANLSDLLSVSTARTNLGLGDVATHSVSEFQPTDSDLTAIAALSTSSFGRGLLTSADAAALRTAAGLGNSATRDVGTTSGTVAAGDDSRIVGAAQKASNLSDLASAATSRTNLGLGTVATADTGTASGNVPLLGAGGRLAIARIASGTPDGTKFVRDDGTLVTPAGGGSVATDTIFDAKGDLAVGTGADTAAKLTVGSNDLVLTSDSTQATGLTWRAASPWTQTLSNDLSSITGFTGLTGTWAVSSGVLRQSATTATTPFRLQKDAAIVTPPMGIVEVEMKFNARSTGTTRMGLFHRFDGSGTNGSVTYLQTTDGTAWTLVAESDFTTVLRNYGSVTYTSGNWTKLRIVYSSHSWAAYLDGVLIAGTPFNSTEPQGALVGLYAYACDASFRNLKVWAPTLPA